MRDRDFPQEDLPLRPSFESVVRHLIALYFPHPIPFRVLAVDGVQQHSQRG